MMFYVHDGKLSTTKKDKKDLAVELDINPSIVFCKPKYSDGKSVVACFTTPEAANCYCRLENAKDKDYDYYEECYGLGLIKNLRLIVHYHDDYDKHQEILDYLTDKIVDEMYDTNKDIMLIALSDNEGIIIDDEKDFKLKIFGRDDQNE